MFGIAITKAQKAKKDQARKEKERKAILSPDHTQWMTAVIINNIKGGVFDEAVKQRMRVISEERKALRGKGVRRKKR